MNINTGIPTVKSNSNVSFEPSSTRQIKFKGKKLKKHLPSDVFYSKKTSTVTIKKKIDLNDIDTSLRSMCLGAPPTDIEKNIISLAYIPTTHNSSVLIASLSRNEIFNSENHENLPIKDVKYFIAQELLVIPDSTVTLEQKGRQGIELYNIRIPLSHIDKQPLLEIPENIITPRRDIELKTSDSSIIYIKRYFPNLATHIYNLTHKCGGAMCIESNVNLLTQHELYELKKNDDMKAILETKSVNKKYNFSIYVNSVITDLTENVYLNFFNIPEADLKSILKNPNIDSLGLTRA
jgi:hypothetical protein